jgi:hypothetical protein
VRILILRLLASSVLAAETASHNITGYTSTPTGIREFSVLVFSDDGRVTATGDAELPNEFPEAIRIDSKR